MRPASPRRTLAGLALTVLLVSCGSSGPSEAGAATDKLSERVETLRDDMRDLEDRVAALEEAGEGSSDAGHDDAGHETAAKGTAVKGTTTDAAHAADDHATGDHAADDHATGDHAADDHAAGDHAAGDHADAGHAAGGAPHWGYADAEHWAELADEFATCGTGEEQSPIDLTRAAPAAVEDARLAYRPSAATIVDNGHTVQVNLADAGTATIDGHEYQLVQFHFHAPSEHTVDGEHSPVEVHFVHKDAEGKLAVIGVMVLKGVVHEAYRSIVDAVPGDQTETPLAAPVDPRALLPEHLPAYRYAGSLTTPPCTEGVTWSVLVEPVRWSPAQVTALTAHFAEANNRPVQDRGSRILRLDTSAG